MKKISRTLVALLLAAAMLVPGYAGSLRAAAAGGAVDPTAGMVGNDTARIDEITVAGRTCYMYVPESNRVGNFLALTPVVVVFGDGKFTAETAAQTAREGGFAALAERDGLCILFANPKESWDSEADANAAAELYAGIYNTYSSRPSLNFVDGKATLTDDNGTRTVYPGSLHGLQFYGLGKGADYIAAHYLENNTYDANYAEQWFAGLAGTPSGVGLFEPSTLTENAGSYVIPMAVVNGPANAEAVAKSYNVGAGVYKVIDDSAVQGFEAELVVELYDEVVDRYYYSQGEFREFPQYEQNGIIEVNGAKTVGSGSTIEYYEYIPDDLDLTKADSVPLFMWFHGIGGEAEAMLSWTEWPLVGKENGFIVIGVDQHTSFTADEIMELLDQILAESPYIDESRLFVGGFSMGSDKTWQVGLNNWQRFAGIMPNALGLFSGSDALEAATKDGGILPVFYIAGGLSAMELGSSAMTQTALQYVWQLNEIGDYSYDEAYEWGEPAYSTLSYAYEFGSNYILDEAGRDQKMVIDAFESADGNVYTWLAVNKNRAHTVTNNDAWTVWEYMKRFSRNPDGSISIDETAANTAAHDAMTAQMVGNDTARIDEITVADRTCYMYVPESNRVGNFLTLTPIVVVFGDEAFTAQTALETAENGGFAELAERDGLCILFVNPTGEGWDSEADADAAAALYAGIYDTYSSRPSLDFVNGKATLTDDKGTRTVYPGSLHGLQFYGLGKGADYIAAHYLENNTYDANYAEQWFAGLAGTPSGVGLFEPSTLTENAGSYVIPMAVVNGPANAQAVADSYNGKAGICEVVTDASVSGFDSDLVVSLYDQVVGKFYYSQGQFREMPKYEQNGIIEVNETVTVSSGKEIEYYAYIPDDLSFGSRDSVPLLMWFHGGGGEAEAMVSWTEWPLVAKENGFMVVSFDQHGSYTSHEAVEVLDLLLAKYSFLDESRVYAGGFSMGGGRTWNLGVKYWDRLAGVIPTAAGSMAEGDDVYTDFVEADVILPTFYIAGGASVLAERPTAEGNNVNEILGYLWTMNDLGTYSYDASADADWGVTPATSTTFAYRDKADFLLGQTLESFNIKSFPSADGNTYTWLCVNANKPHTLTANDAHVAWDYMEHFSRNADGIICIDGRPVDETPDIPDIPDIPDLPDLPVIIPGGSGNENTNPGGFTDVSANAWYADAVEWAVENEITAGTSANTFSPNAACTRAQMVTFLWRASGYPDPASDTMPFTDVSPDAYYYRAVLWAVGEGITTGTSATTFSPDATVTRGQVVSFLYRAAGEPAADGVNRFKDVSESAYYYDAVLWAVAQNVTEGSSANTFSPANACTRAEIVTFLYRYFVG